MCHLNEWGEGVIHPDPIGAIPEQLIDTREMSGPCTQHEQQRCITRRYARYEAQILFPHRIEIKRMIQQPGKMFEELPGPLVVDHRLAYAGDIEPGNRVPNNSG
jgi:hypothetical protein